MLNWFKTRMTRTAADRLYAALVAQARAPVFYEELGVPDTMEGRYELVVLHLFLVMERLRDAGPEADTLARGTLERFVEDMDDCMREIGVGDMTVPKKVKKAAAGFYERSGQLRPLLAGDEDGPLAAHLASVLIGDTAADAAGDEPVTDPRALALAQYVRAAVGNLARTSVASLAGGNLSLPVPGLASASPVREDSQ